MKVKTITGSTIYAAMNEARRLYGDDVVLLETVPPTGDAPARITVMADEPQPASPPPPKRVETPQAVPAGYGYHALSRPDGGDRASEDHAGPVERISPALARYLAGQDADLGPSEIPAPARQGRGQLFPGEGEPPAANPPAEASTARLEKLFEAQLRLLHDRLDRMERRFGNAFIGASQEWGAHPLFGKLLDQGFRPATASSLFDHLAAEGYAPETDASKLQWVVANELRRRLTVSSVPQMTGTQVFIGPGGSGKTSLILKLALHPNFYARRRRTVIVILPEDEDRTPYQNPMELYRRFGIPVQSVQTAEEMQQALHRSKDFDHVLIDTPPMPVHEGAARKMLSRIRQLLDGVLPLDVQFVFDTTRALDSFDAAFLNRLPLVPTTVALTHLDETLRWGRIAEWLMTLGLPVHLVTTGIAAPDSLAAFSPTWFVEKVMEL